MELKQMKTFPVCGSTTALPIEERKAEEQEE